MIALLVVLAVSTVSAMPIQPRKAPLRFVKRGETLLPFFYPGTITRVPPQQAGFAAQTDLQLAYATLLLEIGASDLDLVLDRTYTDAFDITHFSFTRTINGVAVSNQNAAVHTSSGSVVYFSASFTLANGLMRRSAQPDASPIVILCHDEAIKIAEAALSIPAYLNNSAPCLEYLQLYGGNLAYVYTFEVRSDADMKWLKVYVDAQTGILTLIAGQLVQVVDYTSHASYNAVPLPNTTPLSGFRTVFNPASIAASPSGWNSNGVNTYQTTQGNNINAAIGTNRGTSDSLFNFKSNWNPLESPSSPANQQASLVHVFYLLNTVHDIMYQFGFTPKAGNFQVNNFGKGGLGNDAVIVNGQSSSGTNNANFATPPDGQSGVMNMFLWTLTSPGRDGSLDSVIPIHEYTHGISNRLTGGPSNVACLQTLEAAGLGEGWSDAVAVYLTRQSTDTRNTNVPLGWYVIGGSPTGNGIRRFPYSTNMQTNPLVFSWLQTDTEIHRMGEIWSTMLYELFWNLVDQIGFTTNWLDATQVKGNIVALQIVIGGMMMQPCNPTFTDARDAILQAELNFYRGQYQCAIWRAFAKRGLGTDSVQSGWKNGYKVPLTCAPNFVARPQ